MKIFFSLLTFATVVAHSVSLNAQINFKSVTVEVGKQPVAIFTTRAYGTFNMNPDTLNIICLGYDANFNGIFDEEDGDELPSWWKIGGVKNANPNNQNATPVTVRKVRDFPNAGAFFPYRCGLSGFATFLDNFLVVPEHNAIRFYNISQEVDAGKAMNGVADAVSVGFLDSTIFVSIREYDPEDPDPWALPIAHYVKIFNASTYELVDSIPTGNNVQRVLGYRVFKGWTIIDSVECFAVLCENNWGQNSTVEFYESSHNFLTQGMTVEKVRTVEIGRGGNDLVMHRIAAKNNLGAAAIFFFAVASDKISIICADESIENDDFDNYFDSDEILLPAMSSAREMSIQETTDEVTGEIIYSAFISTYSNKIFYLPDLRKTQEFIEIETPKVSEAILNISQDNIVAAYTNIYEDLDFYAPHNTVTIWYDGETSITSDIYTNFVVFPNPVSDVVNILTSQASDVKTIKILDIAGRTVAEISNFHIANYLLQFKLNSTLNKGKYFIQLETSKATLTQTIIVKQP